MAFRNNALSFEAAVDIEHGEALRLLAAGTVTPITDADTQVVVGWSTKDATAGDMIDVRTMFEGTMSAKITVDTAINRGTPLFLANDATLTDDNTDSTTPIATALEDSNSQPFIEVVIYRHVSLPDQ